MVESWVSQDKLTLACMIRFTDVITCQDMIGINLKETNREKKHVKHKANLQWVYSIF